MGVEHAGDERDVAEIDGLDCGIGWDFVMNGEDFAVLDVDGAVFDEIEVVEDVFCAVTLDGVLIRHCRSWGSG